MSNSPSPSKQSPKNSSMSITKKDDMKQTLGEVQQLNKASQQKYKQVKENYELQLPNFKKIRKDLDVIHKSIVKVLVIEERIAQIKEVKDEQSKLQQQQLLEQQNAQKEKNQIENGIQSQEQNQEQIQEQQNTNQEQLNQQIQDNNQKELISVQSVDQSQVPSQNEDQNIDKTEAIENQQDKAQNQNLENQANIQQDQTLIQDDQQEEINKPDETKD